MITVRYLDIAGERWIAPLGTSDPTSTFLARPDPNWIRAGDQRLVVFLDGTALVDEADWWAAPALIHETDREGVASPVSDQTDTPFRNLHPAAKVVTIFALVILAAIAVALLFLLGRWGYHGYLWLWRHA